MGGEFDVLISILQMKKVTLTGMLSDAAGQTRV